MGIDPRLLLALGATGAAAMPGGGVASAGQMATGQQLQPPQTQPPPMQAPQQPNILARLLGAVTGGGMGGGQAQKPPDNQPGAWRPSFGDYLLRGWQGVDQMRDQRRQQMVDQNAIVGQKTERADAQRQQQELEAAIATLPPEEQLWARLNPQAFVAARMRQPEQPDWNLDPVTGQPFTVTPDGQVRYGQGNVNVRPTGGDAQTRPPTGYRFTADGNLEAIPGGPADIRAGESAQRTLRSIDTAVRNQRNVLDAIHTAEGYINGGTTGLMGQVTQGIGGTDSYNLRAAIDTIRANIGFEALQEMRANSQTGGALGQVAVRELELLQATVRNLDQAQSEAQLRRNLAAVRQQYERSIAAMVQARQAYSGDDTQAPTNDGVAPAQPRVLRWNSQTGRLE